MTTLAVALVAVVVAVTTLARDWLYLRAVERYRAQVGDHDKVVEFAATVRPHALPGWRPPAP